MKSRAGHTFRADISRHKLKYNYYDKVSLGETLFFLKVDCRSWTTE